MEIYRISHPVATSIVLGETRDQMQQRITKLHFAAEFAENEGLNPRIYCGEGTPEKVLDINEGN